MAACRRDMYRTTATLESCSPFPSIFTTRRHQTISGLLLLIHHFIGKATQLLDPICRVLIRLTAIERLRLLVRDASLPYTPSDTYPYALSI